MLKSTEHQFWLTKKTVQRKLNLAKEDQHIVSSDAELDAKIEVFKSIAETSTELSKIIDQYQDRLCILSQEECVFGRFLKEVGKRSRTTGGSITHSGKAVSYSGQQRMCVRLPLVRLKHEVNVFRVQAVQDTKHTLAEMEKERTEYRAALSWMKSASAELDPDTGKGLEKFRTAQSHVREAKRNFDAISMDCIQKIDLLAAARCNMYSQALISYMHELQHFAQKTSSTFQTISAALSQKPRYDFCVLKELTQHEGCTDIVDSVDAKRDTAELVTQDKDQELFFADEYSDKQPAVQPGDLTTANGMLVASEEGANESLLIELPQQVEDILSAYDNTQAKSEALSTSNLWANLFGAPSINSGSEELSSFMQQAWHKEDDHAATVNNQHKSAQELELTKERDSGGSKAAWLNLFAEIDPLANPDAFNMKLSGGRSNYQQT